ncbi:hypothetical protein RFI_39162 [Reticulomyxa filosa]|uniref:Uncharacterized protein n=1 Tax=Reticulomyxa filosa TaxID=46433 RepID=X6LB47_RETFI|nr:hypothetical protein RFI_39162 [Reticulomyxa filosa]|eukprot:ETN98351.1 hypothetical protein RFI_39162 [Reticulomyxa filosa]
MNSSFRSLLQSFFLLNGWQTVLAYSFLKIKIVPTAVISDPKNPLYIATWSDFTESGLILTEGGLFFYYSSDVATEFTLLPLIVIAAALNDEYRGYPLIRDIRIFLNSFMNPSPFAMEDMCCGLILLRLNALRIRESAKMNPSYVSLSEIFAEESNKYEIKFDLSDSIKKIDICQNFKTYCPHKKLERPGLYRFFNQKGFDVLLCLKQYCSAFCQNIFISFDITCNVSQSNKVCDFDICESRAGKSASNVDYIGSCNLRKNFEDFEQNKQKTKDEYNDKNEIEHDERKQELKKKDFIFVCLTPSKIKSQKHRDNLISFGSPEKMSEGFASFLMPLWHNNL